MPPFAFQPSPGSGAGCPVCSSRRGFLRQAGLAALGTALSPLLPFPLNRASAEERSWDPASPLASSLPGATGERIAVSPGWHYRVYRTRLASTPSPAAPIWVQIDLGSSVPIDAIKLYPSNGLYSPGDGFPLRFRIEGGDDPGLSSAQLFSDWTQADYPAPGDHIIAFPVHRLPARYIRLTITRLRARREPIFFAAQPPDKQAAIRGQLDHTYLFALAKIDVISGGRDLAVGRPVTVDPAFGKPADAAQLTRPARAQGEGIRTDQPRNVTAARDWQPAAYRAQAPRGGVRLSGGLFHTALECNRRYLLESWSLEDLLLEFRRRSGQAPAVAAAARESSWEKDLPGSLAARFLMGAGNTLLWSEDAELRARLDAVVAGIAAAREPSGYILAFPEKTFFASEHGGYTRSWTTLGLIAAGYAGNARAFELARGYYDSFNRCDYLPEVLRGCVQGGQGMVADTQMYFTPLGKPEDLQVIQRYFQENYWLEDLAARKPEAIWEYPYDRPHCYLLTQLEAYLDLYRATGDRRYLTAVQGGWELYRTNWEQIGGSISIIELVTSPPRSNSLYEKLGEMCGSAFWILLNHRLQLLTPDDERYASEIEKSIYNVILANQDGAAGIRYHTLLVGQKEPATRVNTCCEGQGTRILGSLPQFIYSGAPDGIYINLFEASSFRWSLGNDTLEVTVQTAFPRSPAVVVKVQTTAPLRARIRLRVPGWATGPMAIAVNGQAAAIGTPGTYVALERTWSAGDTIAFTLPIAVRQTRYRGSDQIAGRERYAFEYGPVLLAALQAADEELELAGADNPRQARDWLRPDPNEPLHFNLAKNVFGEGSAVRFVPYFEVKDEFFSCFPIVRTRASALET